MLIQGAITNTIKLLYPRLLIFTNHPLLQKTTGSYFLICRKPQGHTFANVLIVNGSPFFCPLRTQQPPIPVHHPQGGYQGSCCWQDWVPWPQNSYSLFAGSLPGNQNWVDRNSREHREPVQIIIKCTQNSVLILINNYTHRGRWTLR